MTSIWRTLAGAVALGLSMTAAHAATVDISGAGFFDTGTPTTSESAPGHTFAFSFLTPNPSVQPGVADTAIMDPMYTLSGHQTSSAISSVTFQTVAKGGLFDLLFNDGTTLSFFGNYAIDQGGFLQPGPYGAAVGVNGTPPAGMSFGVVAVSVDVAPVPLPDAGLLFGAALLGLGVAGAALGRNVRIRALS